MNKYEKAITIYLKSKGFKLSSEICDQLQGSFGVTNTYARQLVKRATTSGFIKSSTPFTLGKGQFAYSLPNVILTEKRIMTLSKKHRPTLYRLLVSIEINNGIISYYEALKITASPLVSGITKADRLDGLVSLLQDLDIIYVKIDVKAVKYIILKKKKDDEDLMILKHYSRMMIDTAFVKDIKDWIVKSNLIDNSNVVYRNRNSPSRGAEHNNLVWDVFGYTKTTGINPTLSVVSNSRIKQTLVVVDILINREYDQIDLDGFYNRIQIHRNSTKGKSRKVLPIIVYKNCSDLVLNRIRKLGFLRYELASIYGVNISSILESFSKLNNHLGLFENDNVEDTIKEILITIKESGQDDQLKALKGVLFETLMFKVLRNQFPNSQILPNVKYSIKPSITNSITSKEEGYEYDYVIKSQNPKEIVVVELKGYKSDYKIGLGNSQKRNTVAWFFGRTLPFIKKKYAVEIAEGYRFRGCHITSSEYTKEAIAELEVLGKGKLKSKKLDIYYNRGKLLKLIQEDGFDSLKLIIDRFYK